MARARNLKPGFFTNDRLAECSIAARLLFSGLWTIADREGRLEDRPKKIKAEVLPYDDFDCDDLLNQLAKHGFITRYSHEGNAYIQVLNFKKHQNPHVKEAASTIPAPDKPGTNTILAGPLTDSLLLIPSSNTLPTEGGGEPPQVDFKKVFFTEGLKMIGGDTKGNRSLIGQWLRDYGEDAVGAAFMAAQKQSAVEPTAYIIKTLKERKNANTVRSNGQSPGKPTWKSEGKRLADKYREDAEREEQAAASDADGASLRLAEAVRENSG